MNDTRTDEVSDLIVELYTEHQQIAGGMLHVQLDDDNIEDSFWEEPFPEWLLEWHGRQPLEVEVKIVDLMRSMSMTQRKKALGKANQKIRDRGWGLR